MTDTPSGSTPDEPTSDAKETLGPDAASPEMQTDVTAAKETMAEGLAPAADAAAEQITDAKETVVGGLGALADQAGGAKETVAGGLGDRLRPAAAAEEISADVPPVPEHPSGTPASEAAAPEPAAVASPQPDSPSHSVATETAPPVAAAPQAQVPQGIAAPVKAQAGRHRIAADSRGRTKTHAEYRALSRRSLLTGAVGAAAAVFGWRTLQARPVDNRIPDVLRTGHEVNESIWRALFRDGAEAPTFDYAESSMMRVNGRHGIRDELVLDEWELRVVGRNGEQLGTHSVEDLRSMTQTEMTVKHKCVEGWSHIVTWGGVVFSEFLEQFYPDQADAKFVGLATPDNEFRVGLDMDSMMHSQTMLTLDLQREPLSEEHGAPVRLTTPLKYGTKQIKRIGTIEFSDTQPENDYWTVRGYDWYAGL